MLEVREPSPEEKVMRDQKRDIFIFEIKGVFSKVVSFIITFRPTCYWATMQMYHSRNCFVILFVPKISWCRRKRANGLVLFTTYLSEILTFHRALKNKDQVLTGISSPLWSKHHATFCLKSTKARYSHVAASVDGSVANLILLVESR